MIELRARAAIGEHRPLTGVFATRSPDRPNPLGLHRVTIRRIVKNRLRIGPIEAIDGGFWERTIAVNLNSQFYFARRAVPLLKQSLASPCLIATGPMTRPSDLGFRTLYASSNGAVIGLMKSLALELGPHGIRVNAILPAAIGGEHPAVIAARSEMPGAGVDVVPEPLSGASPARRRVDQDDVAALALFLCSPAARNLTGQAVSIHHHAADP